MVAPNQTSSFHIGTSIIDSPAPPAEFFPNSGNLFPKYPDEFPKHAVEVWLFDALTSTGGDAFTVSFLRDNMAAPSGFRVALNASWADGENCTQNIVLPISRVTNEGADASKGRLKGEWRAEEDSGPSATFEVDAELHSALVTFNAPGRITGTLRLASRGYQCLPLTAAEASVGTGAEIFWMRPIAMANAELDVCITTSTGTSKPMFISKEQGGYGGVERSWESMPWMKAVTDSLFVRAQAGPYVLNVMRLVGRPEDNYSNTTSARLYRDGKLVCAPQRVAEAIHGLSASQLGKENALVFGKVFDGKGTPATFRHKNTGYKLEFLADSRWSFELCHGRAWWRFPTSKPGPGATGSSAFVVTVKGGLVGSGDVYEGFGMAGQVEMPE
jgi:hypothetical protein